MHKLLAIVFRGEPGQALEVQRQVAFTGKAHSMSNGGEGPVRGRKQELCSLYPTMNDVLVGREAERMLEEASEVIGTETCYCCNVRE